MTIDNGCFETLSTSGSAHLGGEDIDKALVSFVLEKAGIDVQTGQKSFDLHYQKLRLRCKAAKETLSASTSTVVQVQAQSGMYKNSEITILRSDLDQVIAPLVQRARDVVVAALDSCSPKISPSDVEEVVLVGGSSKVPAIRAMLYELFGKELCASVNAEESVATGAAIRGAILGGVDTGLLSDVMMMDAIPHSIGLEADDGRFEVLLAKNTKIPGQATKRFMLENARQKGVTVEVFEGEDTCARNNRFVTRNDILLPELSLKDEAAGLTRYVDVTFKVTEGGFLTVEAKDPDDTGAPTTSLLVLGLLVFLLFAMYISFKLLFHDPLTSTTAYM